jgi:hypothetical protein
MRNNREYKTNIIDKNICKNDQSAKMKQALHPKVKSLLSTCHYMILLMHSGAVTGFPLLQCTRRSGTQTAPA